MSVDKEVVTLTFKETELSDAGTYKCEASNKLGTVNTECTVDVQSTFVLLLSTASFTVPLSSSFNNYIYLLIYLSSFTPGSEKLQIQ